MIAVWVAICCLIFLFGWVLGYLMRVQERLDKLLAQKEKQAKALEQKWTAFDSSGHRGDFERALRRR